MFKDILNKAKKKMEESEIDLGSVKSVANKARNTVQEKMKEHGVDEVVDKVKKEASVVSKAATTAATEIYKENEEFLEKPVGAISNTWEKVSKHSEELKWAGGIVVGIVAPIPTLIASTAYFLLSEEEMTEEQKEENEKLKKQEPMIVKNSYIEVRVDFESKQMEGLVLTGSMEGKSFEEIGVEKMESLSLLLKNTLKEDEEKEGLSDLSPAKIKEMEDTITLISRWVKYKNK